MKWYRHLVFLIVWSYATVEKTASHPVWSWKCSNTHCQKVRVKPAQSAISLAACQIACNPVGTLWPHPTGVIELSGHLVTIGSHSIKVNKNYVYKTSPLVRAAYRNFVFRIETSSLKAQNKYGRPVIVTFNIKDPLQTQLKLTTNESYALRITKSEDGSINATVSAPTFFGGRHGLETLSQLIVYDDVLETVRIPNDVYITDEPVYSYRGILLDTGRSYITVDAIKRTIDGMSASKLNTFHWHITDSSSFPYVSESNPFLSRIGAYSPSQVYTPQDVENVVEYAREHGVRVIPEFDAPAHVGEGWQETNFMVWFNPQPWRKYCYEPPCGQFDPTQPELYDVLEGLYKDIIKNFNPDMFHMGGDEVLISCWNSSEHIQNWMKDRGWGLDMNSFMKLWNEFQSQALERFDRHSREKLPIIMWASELTGKEYVDKYLPSDRYIIQVCHDPSSSVITNLIEKGYKFIVSNYYLYLDCGFASWVRAGNNWCSPYTGWQIIYDIALSRYGSTNQVLGAEATMWTEQADELTIDNRIWPRAAAIAERLWSNPNSTWEYALNRMVVHRDRLVKLGIGAEVLQPQWCQQNENHCPNNIK